MATEYEQVDAGLPDGAKLGAAATNKLGFFGVTPVVQPAVIAALTPSTETTTSCATAINSIITKLKALGLIAAA